MAAGQAQGGDAGQQGQGQAQDAGLSGQFESLAGSIGELQDFLRSEPWKQAAGPDDGQQQQQDDGLDLSFLDADPSSPEFDPQQIAQQLDAAIKERATAEVTPHLTQMQEQMAEMRREREAEHLVSEFPELGETEVAERVVGLARQMAEQLGSPALANEPKFWRIAYMAGRAADSANTEGSDGPSAAHLEGGGGAGLAGGSQVDLAQQIVNAKGSGARLPF